MFSGMYYKYYINVSALFVTAILTSNICLFITAILTCDTSCVDIEKLKAIYDNVSLCTEIFYSKDYGGNI